MGKFDRLARFLGLKASEYGDDAVKILEKVDTPEFAVSLKGEPRAQYLKALDEVYGDQSKRALEMGFGPEAYYHGTKYDVPSFDIEKTGKSSGMKESGKAIWMSSKPEVAEQYTHNFPFDELNPNIIKLKIKGDYKNIDDLSSYSGKERGKINLLAKEQGKSGVIFKGIRDNIWEGPLAPGESDVVSVFEPKNVRSEFAAFDPRFKESSLLLAGGLAGQQLPEVDISPLPFLKKGAEAYESAKEKIIEPLARQINFTNDPEIQKIAESGLGIVADPLNYISGPIGYGTAALQGLSAFIPKKRGLSDMVEEYNTKRGNR